MEMRSSEKRSTTSAGGKQLFTEVATYQGQTVALRQTSRQRMKDITRSILLEVKNVSSYIYLTFSSGQQCLATATWFFTIRNYISQDPRDPWSRLISAICHYCSVFCPNSHLPAMYSWQLHRVTMTEVHMTVVQKDPLVGWGSVRSKGFCNEHQTCHPVCSVHEVLIRHMRCCHLHSRYRCTKFAFIKCRDNEPLFLQRRQISHTNITKFLGVIVEPERLSLVHEYCPKGSLQVTAYLLLISLQHLPCRSQNMCYWNFNIKLRMNI